MDSQLEKPVSLGRDLLQRLYLLALGKCFHDQKVNSQYILKSSKFLPVINASHSKKFSSEIGPASMPSGGLSVNSKDFREIRRKTNKIDDDDDEKVCILHF